MPISLTNRPLPFPSATVQKSPIAPSFLQSQVWREQDNGRTEQLKQQLIRKVALKQRPL
jgi:hypothetical protein